MVAAVVAALVLPAAAAAAPPALPGAVQPGRDRPLPPIPEEPEFDFRLPAPQRSPVPRAVDEIHFKLNDIHIVGAVTLPADGFRPLFANLIGKDVTLSDILDIADKIEQHYRAAGYVLVRAYVPPQRVKDGIFTINVIEGFVATASVEGSDADTAAIAQSYLQPVLDDKPLRLETIERALLLTNDIPGTNATGVLRPATNTPGASDLIVTETEPWLTGGLAVNNRGSNFSGLWTVSANAAVNGIFGGDQLAASFASTPDSLEQMAGQVSYRKAVGSDGLIASVIGTITHGQPGSTLAAFNVLTDSWAGGARLTYPLIRTRGESILLDGGFTVQDAKVNILSSGFSHDQWRVVDLSVSYLRSGLWGANWAGSLDVAQGLPALGATPNGSPMLSRVDGRTDFTKLTGTARVTRPLVDSFSVAFAAQGQFSFSPLIAGEQITYGGLQIGRGYDPGAITGDHGLGGSLELRYDDHLPQWSISALQPYVFVDGAQTWYIGGGIGALANRSIASTGGGVRFWLPYNVTTDLELARTLQAVPGSDNGREATKVLIDAAINF